MIIRWSKWYILHEIDMSDNYFRDITGVYIIAYWDRSDKAIIVRVGQGIIWNRIKSHRENHEIMRHGRSRKSPLHVTWSEIPTQVMRDGVERFLGDLLHPIEGDRFPDVFPVSVNLPSASRPNQ